MSLTDEFGVWCSTVSTSKLGTDELIFILIFVIFLCSGDHILCLWRIIFIRSQQLKNQR